MSFGSAPSAPAAPDPRETASANAAANEQTARVQNTMNRVNQYTPYGNLEYQDLGNDRWSASQTLSPSQQRQLDLANSAAETYGRAANTQLGMAEQQLSRPFEFQGRDVQYAPDFSGVGDPNQSRDAVEAALSQRMAPSLDQARRGMENQLRNQGLAPGSEAWTAAMRDVSQTENDARLGVIANAGAEQSRMYGLGMQKAGMSNAARQQAMEEQLALRSQPINEASALLSGQMIQQPNFTAVPQVQVANTDYLGAVGQQQAGRQAAYNAQTASANANRTGMFGLGAAAIGAAGSAAVVI